MGLGERVKSRVVEPAVLRLCQWRGDPVARLMLPATKADPYPLYVQVQRRGLVRISNTPGRTRLINFFRLVVAPEGGRGPADRRESVATIHAALDLSADGAGSTVTRKTRGLTRSVSALMVPPLPAASRPSNTTMTRAPLAFTHSCRWQSST